MINIATDLADIVEGMTQYLLETGAWTVVKDFWNVKEEFSSPYLKVRVDHMDVYPS